MPELPEVESVVRSLVGRVNGATVTEAIHVRDDMVSPVGFDLRGALRGRTFASLRRRAKRIVFTLDDDNRFFIHLGMTGQLTLEAPEAPIKPHTHLRLLLSSGLELRLTDPRRFGAIVWLGGGGHVNVGPEPLSLSPKRLVKLLAESRRAVKTLLLDQTVIAGIGNIYADEALHAARIDPRRPANQLTAGEVGRLNRAIKGVLRRAIRAGGSSIRDYVDGNGQRGGYQAKHKVYDRAGKPCRNCRGEIVRVVLGGRSTHYCADCQK